MRNFFRKLFHLDENEKIVLHENEVEANIALSKGCIVSSILLLLIWIFYLTGLFSADENIKLIINIILPINIVIMLTPLIFIKRKEIKKTGYKYFLIVLYVVVFGTLTVVLPKHTIIIWPILFLLTAHYYSPRLSLVTYILVSVAMLECIYLGMLFGEWDRNLMGLGEITDDVGERIEYLNNLMASGDNRWLKAFTYYYLPRFVVVTLAFIISIQLSLRTSKLLVKESSSIQKIGKINTELSLASGIQSNILPNNFPSTEEFEIYASMNAAKEVGGDFYDFYLNKTNELIFDIGDVSGKGIPASLFMMHTKTLLKSYSKNIIAPEKVLEETNKELCANNETEMFVTSVIGKLNLDSGELVLSNAGHNPILIKRNDKFEFLHLPTGFVLGGFETSRFKAKCINLLPGDEVFLYTDGVTEATNKNGELFGEKRLLDTINKYKNLSSKELCKKIQEEINLFVDKEQQFDDITMLSVIYKGKKTLVKEITVDSLASNLDIVTDFVTNFIDHYSDNLKAKNQIRIAIDELFSNIVKFAYHPEVGKAIVRLELRESPVSVSISFIDHGKPFNPLEIDNPDLDLSAEEREAGGLGIFIVKQSMDEIKYEYSNNSNILTIKKRL